MDATIEAGSRDYENRGKILRRTAQLLWAFYLAQQRLG
jgi:hypothetical protein